MKLDAAPPTLATEARPAAAPKANARAKAEAAQAAQQFEAMMLKQLLAQAMPKLEGLGQNWVDLALDGVATEISRGMPLGLAKMLEADK